jgi:hypothetical protein
MHRCRVSGIKAAMGQQKQPWLVGTSGDHFVSVFLLFYMVPFETNTENKLISIINDKIF